MVTVAVEGGGRVGGWRLRVDGRPYGRFAGLEDVNRLLSRLAIPDPELAGAAPCDYRVDTAALPAGRGPRPNAGLPCGLYASRTVIWESPGMIGVRLCCAAHVGVYADVSPEWFTWVLGRPVRRGDRVGFDKYDAAGMSDLAALLAGQGLPPGALPGLLRETTGNHPG